MKKRKHKKRSTKRGGRTMTVTTSSRVVKTTRMNPKTGSRSIFHIYHKPLGTKYIYPMTGHTWRDASDEDVAREKKFFAASYDPKFNKLIVLHHGEGTKSWGKAFKKAKRLSAAYAKRSYPNRLVLLPVTSSVAVKVDGENKRGEVVRYDSTPDGLFARVRVGPPGGKEVLVPASDQNAYRSNPHDPHTAQTQRMPAIRAMIPAGGGKDPRTAETRRLKVITSSIRKNPVRSLVVPRTMWKRLKPIDKKSKHGHRYVRCKTRRGRRAFWLPCTVR